MSGKTLAYAMTMTMNPFRLRFTRALCLLLAALMAPGAHAMCIARLEAGFPHADVRHYPANVRGVLFQVPVGNALSAQDFAVSSPDDRRALRLHVEAVALPGASAAARNLPDRVQLVRLMIEGGYAPGATYTIRYTAPRSMSTQYPDTTTFSVDPEAVNVERGDLSVLAHPPEVGMHLVMRGHTGVGLLAATRRLSTQVSGALQRYRHALAFFPEEADVGAGGEPGSFEPLRQTADACSGVSFGRGEPDRPDVVYQECGKGLNRKAVRVIAGFLELGDQMLELPQMTLDWGAETEAACAAILRKQFTKTELRDAMDRSMHGTAPVSGDRKD